RPVGRPRPPPSSPLFPYTTLFRSITELRPAALDDLGLEAALRALARRAKAIDGLDVSIEMDLPVSAGVSDAAADDARRLDAELEDRKSTRLNSSHGSISYAVFCLI